MNFKIIPVVSFVRFRYQKCCNLHVFLGVKFDLKVLLRVKELKVRNSGSHSAQPSSQLSLVLMCRHFCLFLDQIVLYKLQTASNITCTALLVSPTQLSLPLMWAFLRWPYLNLPLDCCLRFSKNYTPRKSHLYPP